jgi:ABC-type multidrug transport system fused ATPase/permease subunit
MMMRHGRGLAREKEHATDSWGVLRRLLTYFGPYAASLVIVFVLLVLNSAFEILSPYLIEIAVDLYIVPSGRSLPAWLGWLNPAGLEGAAGLLRVMLLLLGVYLLRWFSMAGQSFLMNVVGQKVLMRMRTQILERIHTLSLKFFDEREAGDLMSRLVNDTQVINQVFTNGIVRMLSVSLNLVGIVVTMVSRRWDLALVSFSMLPVMLIMTSTFARRARRAFRRTRETIGDVSSELQENIAGVREVQAFARERANVSEFQQINRANRDANVQAQTLTSAFSPALDVVSTVALALVLGYGGWSVVRGTISLGMVVGFMTYVQRFYRPIQMVSSLWTQFQSALAGAERIFELLDTEPEVVDAPGAVEMPPVEGRVIFDHVSFHYKPDEPVLRDVTINVAPGQTVALVGPTGAGKTSMISLLTRFYDVVEGRILVDGYDVRQVEQATLRRQMGIVLQDTFLFSTTVMDNIRYGRLDASDEDVIAAAKLANAHDFVERLPEGYATNIGERGSNLSQGQRQLLAISRAVLADPGILILDEATSSVDTRTERHIQDAMLRLMEGRTSFVIAHRLSTIREADMILVINGGEVIERGSHEELLAQHGFYHNLYMSQFKGQHHVVPEPVGASGASVLG